MTRSLTIALLVVLALSTRPAQAQFNPPPTYLPPHPVGYIGCSISKGAAFGYTIDPGKALSWPAYNTGGGRIDLWADPGNLLWSLFRNMVSQNGAPKVVWVELCEQLLEATNNFAQVQAMFANLRQHAPQAVFFVSAITSYNPPDMCPFLGPNAQGLTDTAAWRDLAVAQGLAKLGPSLGPLTSNLVNIGRCDPNTSGSQFLGLQLHSFFDRFALP